MKPRTALFLAIPVLLGSLAIAPPGAGSAPPPEAVPAPAASKAPPPKAQTNPARKRESAGACQEAEHPGGEGEKAPSQKLGLQALPRVAGSNQERLFEDGGAPFYPGHGPRTEKPAVSTTIADGLQAGEGSAIPEESTVPGPRGEMSLAIGKSERAERGKIQAIASRFDDGTGTQGGDRLPPAKIFPLDEAEGRAEGAPCAAITPVSFRDYPRSTTSPYNTICPTAAPPDANLAVGVDWVITDHNSYFTVYNKSGTRQFAAPYASIAASAGLTYCGAIAGGWGTRNPQALYDDENDRYILMWLATDGTDGRFCMAVTKTNDPRSIGTVNWWVYQYDPAGSATVDESPRGGIGQDAIFYGCNRFAGGSFGTSAVVAFNKTKAYNGTLAAVSGTDYVDAAIPGYATPQPAERRGYPQAQYPPSGTRHFICATNTATGGLDIWGWPYPTMTNTPSIWASAVLGSPGAGAKPSSDAITAAPVDNLSGRYMDCEVRWPYLYTARTGADTDATYDTIQWAQIKVNGATPTLTNSNEYSRAANSSFNWMPDVTSDYQHNMAIAYNFADDTGPVYIGGYIAGREFQDAANTMLDGGAVAAGGKVYDCGYLENGSYRWGETTGCAADPNGCTIWVLTEFVENNACTLCDATWLRNYRFASCGLCSNISLDDSRYTCLDTLTVTVTDSTALTAQDCATYVTLSASGTGDSEHIPPGSWTCGLSCSGGTSTYWTGTLPVSGASGAGGDGTLNVTHGGVITATYADPHSGHSTLQRTAGVNCQAALSDGGFSIQGGCDNDSPEERFAKYMDNGEYPAYTYGIFNSATSDLTDVTATLSCSGPGSAAVTIFNPTVSLGRLAANTLGGAVFNLVISGAAPASDVTMDLSVTSPADGLTVPVILHQPQILQADDIVGVFQACFTHNSADFTASTMSGYAANPWTNGTAWGGETNVAPDEFGLVCGDAFPQSYATAPNAQSGTSNFNAYAFESLGASFAPAHTGNAPNGRPWRYTWVRHSFYTAVEANGNTSGLWGVFYNDAWNSPSAPTAQEVYGFPISSGWATHNAFDWGLDGFDWDAANTNANRKIITFADISGETPVGTYWALAHFHADREVWGLPSTTRRDVALDNDQLVYYQYYADGDSTPCAGGSQVGQVSFDQFRYGNCPASAATLTVVDDNAGAGPLSVTITSTGGLDSEAVSLAKVSGQPRYTGALPISSAAGAKNGDGTLFVLPGDDLLTATYADSSPSGTSVAYAHFLCADGDVVYASHAQVSDNGDNDGTADNNETVVMDLTIRNNMATALTNTVVTIASTSSTIDCIPDAMAFYGTVAGGGTAATNPSSDRFVFHVAPSVQCTDWSHPPTATFVVTIAGDGFYGSSTLQEFTIDLDLDGQSGGSYTYTQSFGTDPAWTTGATADEDGTCTGYSNNFRYRPDGHGAGNGCYGAWLGTGGSIGATGTTTGLPTMDSSTLYSPVFIAAGNVTLTQDIAYRCNATYNGAKVQASVNGGAWTNLAFTTPAQSAVTTNAAYCYPGDNSPADSVWNSTAGQNWTTTNAATVAATDGQTVQFRWRIGIDSSGGSSRPYSGFGVDNISITNLRQTISCEPTRNTGLPTPCVTCTAPGAPTLTGATGTCAGVSLAWTAGTGTTNAYNVYRSANTSCPAGTLAKLNASPLPAATLTYNDTAAAGGTTYTYVVRGACDATGTVESANSNCSAAARLVSPTPTITGGSANTCPATAVVLTTESGESSYQWYSGGIPIGGATAYQYTAAATGSYTVSYTAANGCSGTSAAKAVTISACAPNIVYLSHGTITAVDGNGNATLEAGEKWSVQVTLLNSGNLAADSVQASLSGMALGDGIAVCDNPGAFGSIAAGGTATCTYTFLVDPAKWYGTYACGSNLTFNIVSKSTTTSGCTCASEMAVFSNAVGITGANQTATQVTTPLNATNSTANSTLAPAFTITGLATAATLSYTSAYAPAAGTPVTLFGPDDAPGTSGNWTLIGYASNAAAGTCGTHTAAAVRSANLAGTYSCTKTTSISTVGYTNITVGMDWRVTTTTATQYLDWSTDGSTWNLGAASINTTALLCNQSVALPAGAAGQAMLTIRFRTVATSTGRGIVDYISIGGTPPGSGTWTANARVSLVDPSSTVTVLKAYGSADASPYNVAAYYTGSGTYGIRLEENNGGMATLTAGSMNVTKSGTCATWAASCNGAAPGEAAPGTTPATSQGWTGKTTHTWPNTSGATSYKVYRGILSQLPFLLNGSTDSCVKYSGASTNCPENDSPASVTGRFFWYLVTAVNGRGEGTAGNATAGPRVVNSTGTCP